MRYLLYFCLTSILTSLAIPAYAEPFSLSSAAFANQGAIPTDYTCDGKDVSPALRWSHAPTNAQSLVLIVSDPDAPHGTFYHWILYNLPKSDTSLTTGASNLPLTASVGVNSWGSKMYRGPCPPAGTLHHYLFTLYALDTRLDVVANADARDVLKAITHHVMGQTTLKGSFSH